MDDKLSVWKWIGTCRIFIYLDKNKNQLNIKFDRKEFITAFNQLNGEIEVSLIGYLDSGVTFIGKDVVKVIH